MIFARNLPAFAGKFLIALKSETVEISEAVRPSNCQAGDDGFRFTAIFLDTQFLPTNFGANFRASKGISLHFPNRNGRAFPCSEALKPITDGIDKQSGELNPLATRELRRFTNPDRGCQLFLVEKLRVQIGFKELSGVATFFVDEFPAISPIACKNLAAERI